jgi:hypothetical protein
MSSDFAIFTDSQGADLAVKISEVQTVCGPSANNQHTRIFFKGDRNDFLTVKETLAEVLMALTLSPPPAQLIPGKLIPCDPMPLGITIEQLGAVIAELTPMLEAIVQAKQA